MGWITYGIDRADMAGMVPHRTKSRTIDEARLQRFNGPGIRLSRGTGPGLIDADDGSLMNWVNFLAGGDGADEAHGSVDPVLAAFCLQLNDALPFTTFRQDLKPFAARLVATAEGAGRARRRAALCADLAVRTLVPLALRRTAPDLAAGLRAAPTITSRPAAREGSAIARTVQEALATSGTDGTTGHEYRAARAAADAADALITSFQMADGSGDEALAEFDSAPQVAVYAATCAAHVASSGRGRDAWDASLARLERLIDAP